MPSPADAIKDLFAAKGVTVVHYDDLPEDMRK
jgi:hypothetical protein